MRTGSAALAAHDTTSAAAAAARMAFLIIFPPFECPAARSSEIGFEHPCVVADGLRVAAGDQATFREHIDEIALGHDDAHLVINEEDGDALGTERTQMLDDPVLQPRIDARERFVEQ